MSTPYFYGLNTFPIFLVQSVDVTFSGQNKVYMVCTGLHPDAPRCIQAYASIEGCMAASVGRLVTAPRAVLVQAAS
jgi:hypothetical protein